MDNNNGNSVDEKDYLIENSSSKRMPKHKFSAKILWLILLSWSLFQLWIASPLPYIIQIGVWNDTITRSIHLAFSVFLAFTIYTTFKSSPKSYIPIFDWVLAIMAAFCCAYIAIYYNEISSRIGAPNTPDLIFSGIGILLLLEAARRSLGLPMMLVACFFLLYVFLGSWEGLPDVVRWKGASYEKAMSHMWLTTEGVFGIALGVSSSYVFLFVLFGALLNNSGAGNYFVKIAFSLLGHLRGGPAKAAVLSSAMTGLISGSSIANVVTTGTFTIPLMKKVGFTPEKAGAIEVASSVNGVLTPPVMGAVAFLMTEYVGISYVEVVKHAIVPALISYIALIYIVHIEAMKNDMHGLEKQASMTPLKARLIVAGIKISSFIILLAVVYYAVNFFKIFLGGWSVFPILALLLATYIYLVYLSSQAKDLIIDSPEESITKLPKFSDISKSGLYYVLPIMVLIWFLVVEWKSPAFSAFWASLVIVFILITQKPLKSFFRSHKNISASFKEGLKDLGNGLTDGAENMVGLAAAMGVAGLIVGTVTLTGVGQVMAEFVELLSGGNLLAMLFFVALISIILGMGLPTTANYIVVSSLMAGVVVELGAQSGLVVPLIAVHMFCFYYGIMADVTPPVGLASFAAAAISGADPIKTGVTAFYYSLRTALLPFLFIFNTDLLLIDVNFYQAIFVFFIALIAMFCFVSSTMGFLLVKSRFIESIGLMMISFALFRPGFFLDQVSEPYLTLSPDQIFNVAEKSPDNASLRLSIEGENIYGEFISSVFVLPLGIKDDDGAMRLEKYSGIEFEDLGDNQIIVSNLTFGGEAEQAGIDFDWELKSIQIENDRIAKEVFYIPALSLLMIILYLQRQRKRKK